MIVQRHYTLQPNNMMLLWYSASGRSPSRPSVVLFLFVFCGVPLGSGIVIWYLRQSQRKSLGLLVPRFLDDVNVPYLVRNTPKISTCESESEAEVPTSITLSATQKCVNKTTGILGKHIKESLMKTF